MISKALFSSASEEWETPQDFFDKCATRWGPFDLDVCATKENAKCEKFFTKEDDALTKEWSGVCWMNPPYGRGIGVWVQKAYSSVAKRVVCLLPARTDTRWFHDYCVLGRVEFVRGRLKFGGSKNSAPFPSMLVIFERLSL